MKKSEIIQAALKKAAESQDIAFEKAMKETCLLLTPDLINSIMRDGRYEYHYGIPKDYVINEFSIDWSSDYSMIGRSDIVIHSLDTISHKIVERLSEGEKNIFYNLQLFPIVKRVRHGFHCMYMTDSKDRDGK